MRLMLTKSIAKIVKSGKMKLQGEKIERREKEKEKMKVKKI